VSPLRVPLVVAAKNEERSLGPCLDSLLASAAFAEARLDLRFDPLVVLDDCTDATDRVARSRGVRTLPSSGGKVEAQRAGLSPGAPFHVFSDADVAVDPETLLGLARAMIEEPGIEVAFPKKRPLPPERASAIARAIHVYNVHRGFSARRSWFNGKLFAIRNWSIPTRAEIAARAARLGPDRFYQAHLGLRAEDVYLSRTIVRARGPEALRETADGMLWFRAPETLRGAYRYYRRIRMEVERLDRLFPETREDPLRHGVRRTDPAAVARATPEEQRLFRLFQAMIAGFRALYAAERTFYLHASPWPCEGWTPIEETKRPIASGPGA
jgi:glycosyltransferase involved in cell wall biosynthesis